MSPQTRVRLFLVVALAEAISWAGLLTGMYLKYLTDAGELGVKIFGPLHGGIFVAYVLLTLLLARTLRWSAGTTVIGLVCSVPPFATLVFELWAQRTGRLEVPAGDTQQAVARAQLIRYLQLVLACTVLGVGVGFLLEASLGSDGYSSLVNGLTIASGMPFWVLNILVGAAFIGMAWLRGTRPGPGTVVQWFLVGFVISGVMALLPDVDSVTGRVACLALAFVLIAAGVAGYLASNTGAGPAEAAALAWDPPIPFRWSYSLVQGGGALVGWLLGAAIGPGTILVILLLGPAVDLFRRRVPALERVR